MKTALWIRLTLACLGVVAAMFAVFVIVLSAFPDDWRAVDAEVMDVRIEGTRMGTLDWSVFVDYTYEVDGERHEKRNLNVFHATDLGVVEARSDAWPVGGHFTIYVDREDAGSVSLAADGGGQAAAVVAALLTPMVLALIFPFVIVLRRSRRARRRAAAL